MTQTLNQKHLAADDRTDKTRKRVTLLLFFLATLTATAFNAPKAHAGCPGYPSGCSRATEKAVCGGWLSFCYSGQPYPSSNPIMYSAYNTKCYTEYLACKASALTCPCP